MRTPTGALLVVAILLAQGCSVEKTDLSPIYKEPATRSDIEAVLGEPVVSRATDEGHISIYQYNTGEAANVSRSYRRWMNALTVFTLVGGLPLAIAADSTPEKGYLAVVYSADDPPRIVKLSRSGDPDAQMDRLVAGLELKRRADAGDADAMYQYALWSDDRIESWKFRCLAASQNHPAAQGSVANHYRLGLDPVRTDRFKAFVWYQLAESNGYDAKERVKAEKGSQCCERYSELLADKMTPSDLAGAKRLANDWSSNPAQCERDARPAAELKEARVAERERRLELSLPIHCERAKGGDIAAQWYIYRLAMATMPESIQTYYWARVTTEPPSGWSHTMADFEKSAPADVIAAGEKYYRENPLQSLDCDPVVATLESARQAALKELH